MENLIVPQVAFTAHYEDNIKNVIFDAMDCHLWSNKHFGTEYRWFKDFPEFVLTKAPTFHDKDKREVSRNHGKYFDMSISRINYLYNMIKNLFPTGKFISSYNQEYDITVHQIFSLGNNVWANIDLQSVFYCSTPIMPEEYQEWMNLAIHHDYTYMYSDSGNTYKAGRESEKRMLELLKTLDKKVCTLWHNYILGRKRTRPQDSCFGMGSKEIWNTLEETYKEFRIIPDFDPYVELGEAMVNTPCIGFPSHPKRIG